MEKALQGVRVLDLTWAYSGPFLTMQMGDFGADVVKVERRGVGDISRFWEPKYKGESLPYLCANRNKRSITLDMESEQGRQIVLELVRWADVLVENFRPGSMEYMHIPYDLLMKENPRLIIASLSGYGQTGPYKNKGALSNIAEAYSGFMSVNGFPDGVPVGDGMAFGDSVTGLFALNGILMALYHREKTGRGQHIDVAMVDCMTHMMMYSFAQYDLLGENPQPAGNRIPAGYPYDMFRAQDGYVFLSCSKFEDFAPFATALEQPELAQDARFATNAARLAHREELFQIIEAWTSSRPRQEILDCFDRCGQLCAPVLQAGEVMENEQIIARQMMVSMEDPTVGAYRMQGIPVKMSGTPGSIERGAPQLGAQTDEILAALGHSDDEIAVFHQNKIV